MSLNSKSIYDISLYSMLYISTNTQIMGADDV